MGFEIPPRRGKAVVDSMRPLRNYFEHLLLMQRQQPRRSDDNEDCIFVETFRATRDLVNLLRDWLDEERRETRTSLEQTQKTVGEYLKNAADGGQSQVSLSPLCCTLNVKVKLVQAPRKQFDVGPASPFPSLPPPLRSRPLKYS